MKKLMTKLMLSCVKATELIDKKAISGLSITQKIQLRVHTSLCDGCKAYQKQSVLLDELLKRHLELKNNNQDVDSIKELRNRILTKL
jgi:hypothetical protein